ncbi:MAG: hydrogen gas-evolving membrane-bound hydrogenase subunit E [Acidimicrobiales bacterium]|nr:hydrogen gas-evolving membrane-bound hydrogenase subunit E [Acidimicrobiales bacterium]
MLVLLLLHATVGAAILLGARLLGRRAFLVGALPMLGVLAVVAGDWSTVTGGGVVEQSVTWVEGLSLVADTRLDGFALLMTLLVSGMGVVVLAYGRSYFADNPASARIAGLLVLFAGSMLGLVLADNLIWLYACWELTSITSYLLIGRDQRTAGQRTAALQALLVTGAGGLAMLAGFVILAQAGDTWSMSELLADPPSGATVGTGLGLVLIGIFTKSAQYPFHFWLPGAMVAPTPISAYLHSATMVKAGVYLAARFAPAFAALGIWRPVVIGVGVATMVFGALRALRQDDLKLLLAFGTVSQLGFMMVLAGAGHPEATKAVCVLLVAHALFKGALFLVVGVVDHETGTRDRREIGGLGQGWAAVRVVAVLSAASMAGLPPLAGFIAKESAYEAFVHHGGTGDLLTLVGIVAGSVLTFAYSSRFVAPFLARTPASASRPHHVPRPVFVAPLVVLGAGTVLAGVTVAPVLDDLVRSAANALDSEVGDPKLALWHGFNAALGLSALTIALGVGLFVARERLARAQAALAPPLRGDEVFTDLLRVLNATARRVTAFVQPGSLPLSIGVILVVVIGTPSVALALEGTWPGWGEFSEVAPQPVLAGVIVIAGLAVATVRRRFAAVLLLGSVGYAMALVFAFQGAPDLALTQFAVETLSIVVFMLVIRHLPERFRAHRFRAATAMRVGIASLVAAGVFGMAMMTAGGTDERAVSDEIVEQAEPEGGGKNVVNVVLVDVRGLDTLGEITVLAVAAVGVVALARIGRRPRDEVGAPPEKDAAPTGAEAET